MIADLYSLLEKIRQGDENAFALLCREYRSVTENAVLRFLPSFGGEDNGSAGLYNAEDLRQYATIALYRAAITYDPEAGGKSVTFGLYAKICINRALISQLRKYRSELRRKQRSVDLKHPEMKQGDPLQQLVSREGAEELREKIYSCLSKYEKDIFDYYIVGKSVGEIAERLGKDEKSVSNALYRMKVKVRGLLKNQ